MDDRIPPSFSPKKSRPQAPVKQRPRFSLMRVFGRIFRMFFLLGLFAGLMAAGIVLYFSQNLPDVREIYTTFRRPSITLYDSQGSLIATYGDTYGEMVSVETLPPHVSQALLAVEDRRFYDHFGIDVLGIIRAFWVNYRAGSVVQGGSTLTQQLAKNLLQAQNLYTPTDRSLKRKIQEAILAILLESKLTKKQILTLYLNRVYFGSGAFGVDAASMRYFGRHAHEINLYEAATLMGLLKAPSRYSPAQNPERSDSRARQVLQKMLEAGFVTQNDIDAALTMATIEFTAPNFSSVRYFTNWVVDTLSQYVSLDQDLTVTTTIDPDLQEIAERKSLEVMATTGKQWQAEEVAMVAMTPDGAVKALIGGTDYRKTQYNRATQALRQPGSTFKFFTFLAALEAGMTSETLVSDLPFSVGKWHPKNYRYTPQGSVSLTTAFAKSVNASAVRLAVQMGVPRLIRMARKLGITTKIPRNLSIALGTGEMTLMELMGAFGTVANQGIPSVPHGITEIRNKQGHLLFQWESPKDPILSPEVVENMRILGRAVIQGGTGRSAAIPGWDTFGKSGTSQNYRDTWFFMGTPLLVVGTWAGRDSDKPMTRAPGGTVSTHLCRLFLMEALEKTAPQKFQTPFHLSSPSEGPKDQTSTLDGLFDPGVENKQNQAFKGWETSSNSLEVPTPIAPTNADTVSMDDPLNQESLDDLLAESDSH